MGHESDLEVGIADSGRILVIDVEHIWGHSDIELWIEEVEHLLELLPAVIAEAKKLEFERSLQKAGEIVEDRR